MGVRHQIGGRIIKQAAQGIGVHVTGDGIKCNDEDQSVRSGERREEKKRSREEGGGRRKR